MEVSALALHLAAVVLLRSCLRAPFLLGDGVRDFVLESDQKVKLTLIMIGVWFTHHRTEVELLSDERETGMS